MEEFDLAGNDQKPGTGVVEAQEFVLKDGGGVVRGRLGCASNGEPRLLLLGKKGMSCLELGLRCPDGSPGLALGDATGRFRGGFLLDEAGNPTLSLHGANGVIRVVLRAEEGKGSGLVVSDADGVPRIDVLWDQEVGMPSVRLHDRQGKP